MDAGDEMFVEGSLRRVCFLSSLVIPYFCLVSSPRLPLQEALKIGPTGIGNTTNRCATSRGFGMVRFSSVSASVDPVRDKKHEQVLFFPAS